MWELDDYRIATNPAEAVEMMTRGPGKGMYIAGGTDLILAKPKLDFVVDISRAGLNDIARTPAGDLFIGAGATLEDLVTNPLVQEFAGGVISRVAAMCGNRPVRTNATVGGNLCNALPSADMAPVLLALDASCFVMGDQEQESMPLEYFFVGPRQTVLDGRLLVGLALPAEAAQWRCASRKMTRSAEDISLVQVAVSLGLENDVVKEARIALGAVAPVPMRSTLAENMLLGQKLSDLGSELFHDAGEMAAGEAAPITDKRASAEYRREITKVLTRRLLAEALDGDAAGGGQ